MVLLLRITKDNQGYFRQLPKNNKNKTVFDAKCESGRVGDVKNSSVRKAQQHGTAITETIKND